MKKKNLLKKIRKLKKRVNELEKRTGPEIRQIGFHYLADMEDENEHEDMGY